MKPRISRLRRAAPATVLAAVTLAGVVGHAHAAAETFNTALPVSVGSFVLRVQGVSMLASDDPTLANREQLAWGAVGVLGYGVTPRWTLFVMQPWLHKQIKMNMGGMRIKRSTSGLGDTTWLARYTAFTSNVPGRTWRVSPYFGLTTPTGRDDAHDAMGRLPQPLQPGSGAWGGTVGVVSTWQTLHYEFDTQVQYLTNSTAHHYRFGDTVRLDASLQYRIWPRHLGNGLPGFLYGVIEANWIHQASDRSFGATVPETDGTTLWLDPGLQYVTRNYVLEAIVQLPVGQHLHGLAVKSDRNVFFGFRLNL